ncbi:MAG: amidohydrolase family protein, partial [Selenomonadaceae bacterium]|nr:amidohydrolase family protein [Selenomonadaceae bacterium]
MKAIINGRLIVPNSDGNFIVDDRSALVFDGLIRSIGSTVEGIDEVIDARGMYVAPGFVNIHIHGCAGADAMDAQPSALETMRAFLPTTGVTSFLPTTMTMPLNEIRRALDNIRRAMTISGGAKILGANL